MRSKTVFVFSLLVLCLFAFTVCGPPEEEKTEAEKKEPAVEAQEEEEMGMTKQEEMMAKMVFSEEAESYITEVKEKKWKGEHPKMKLADQLIGLKNELEGDSIAAAERLEDLGAQINLDKEDVKKDSIKSVFSEKYPGRNFVFEIQEVSVKKVPDNEKRYLGEETEENRVDLIAHVKFAFRLVQTSGAKNQSGTGTFESPHRNDCVWDF